MATTHLEKDEKDSGVRAMAVKSLVRAEKEKSFVKSDLLKLKKEKVEEEEEEEEEKEKEKEKEEEETWEKYKSEKHQNNPNSNFFNSSSVLDVNLQPFLNFSGMQDLTKTKKQLEAAKTLTAATPKVVRNVRKVAGEGGGGHRRNRNLRKSLEDMKSFSFEMGDVVSSAAGLDKVKSKRLTEMRLMRGGGGGGGGGGGDRERTKDKEKEDVSEWQIFHLGQIANYRKKQRTLPRMSRKGKCQFSFHETEAPLLL